MTRRLEEESTTDVSGIGERQGSPVGVVQFDLRTGLGEGGTGEGTAS